MTEAEKLILEIKRLVRETPTPTGLGLRIEDLFPEERDARLRAQAGRE